MAIVQFFGKEQVLRAADNIEAGSWSLFVDGNMFIKHEGIDKGESSSFLLQMLEMLEESHSQAVYTIKFFENSNGKPPKINAKSVCDAGSFKFKLIDPEQRDVFNTNFGSTSLQVRELSNKLQAQEAEIKLLRDQLASEEEEEEEETIGSVVMGLLKRPDQLAQVVNLVTGIFSGKATAADAVGAIGSIMPPADNGSEMQPADLDRLASAIDRLQVADPNIIAHLEKLADIAENNPAGFKQMLSLLDMQ